MKIETLDNAISISNNIDQLEEIKNRIQESPLAGDALRSQFSEFPGALPHEDAMTELTIATTEFNEKWVKHIDEKLCLLRDEFEAL